MKTYKIEKSQFAEFGARTREMSKDGQAQLRRGMDPQKDGSLLVYVESGDEIEAFIENFGQCIASPN